MEVAHLRALISVHGAGQAKAALGGVEKAGLSAAKTMGAALGAAGLGAALVATGKAAIGFESQMAEVGVVTKATGKQMAAMSDAALDLGSRTGKGAGKAAEAIKELAKGGVAADQILSGGLKGAMDLAAAGGMDVAEAAVSVSDALNLFGLEGKSATHVADAFAKAANDTTADVSHFTQALSQVGGGAKAAGLSFDETVVALEALALAGVKGSDAGTSLKAALAQIVKPTKESAETMKSLGLEFFNAEGNMKPLADVAGMLQSKMKGLTREQRLSALQTIAGTDGFRALLALMEQGAPGIGNLSKGLEEQGTAAEVASAKLDTVAGGFSRVKGALESLAIEATGTGMGPLADGLNAVANAVDSIREGEPLDKALGLDNLGLGDAFGDAGADLQAFIADIRGAVEGVANIFDTVFGNINIGDFIGRLGGSLATGLSGVAKTIKSAITLDFAGVFDGLAQVGKGAFEQLAAGMGAVVDLITAPFKAGVDVVLGLITGLGDAAAGVFDAMSGLPGGGVFGGMADQLRSEIDAVNEFRESLRAPIEATATVTVDTAAAEQALASIENTELRNKVVSVLGQTTDAKSKFDQLIALGIPEKTAYVLAETAGAVAQIMAVGNLRVPDIRVGVTMFLRNSLGGLVGGGGGGGGGGQSNRGAPAPGGAKRASGSSVTASASKKKRVPYEIAAAMADIDLARAEGTPDTLDDFRALGKQRKAARQRLGSINKKLRQKIKTEDRARLLEEKARLYGDLNRIKSAEADLRTPPSTSLTDLATAQADVQIAMAQTTADTSDDIAALTARQEAVKKRITAIRVKLKQKGLRRDDKVRLNEELARLIGESNSTAKSLADLAAPTFTASDYARAAVGEASLTADLGDDVTAAQRLVDVFNAELAAARATGDPTKIAEAAQNLKSASDQLNGASEAIRIAYRDVFEQQLTAGEAALTIAKVRTPDDVGDDLVQLGAKLATASQAFEAAIGAGDNQGIIRFGGEVLALRGAIEDLNKSTGDQTAILQAQLDVQKEQLEQQSRTIAAQGANLRGFEKYVAGVASGEIAGTVNRRRDLPTRQARY